MATLVLTVIGDDQSGLVDALSGVVARHRGNWERSHMARLEGKFAGIVVIEVAAGDVDGLVGDLAPLESHGLLDITVERAATSDGPSSADYLSLQLVGHDRPGIVHEISHALAERNVSIEELQTETMSAPMANDPLFEATAVLRAPAGLDLDELRTALEDLANELMVDIDLDS